MPLYYALDNLDVSFEIVKYLAQQWPRYEYENDHHFLHWVNAFKGCDSGLPFQLASQVSETSVDAFASLLDLWPGAEESSLSIPLFLACKNQAQNFEIISLMLNKYLKAVQFGGGCNHRTLPIHLVCGNLAPLDVIQLIVQAWPEAIRAREYWETLPLHHLKDQVSCGPMAQINAHEVMGRHAPIALCLPCTDCIH